MAPHWFAVTRLADNKLSGLMREIAELIDETDDPATLRNIRVSLQSLTDGAHVKAWQCSKGKVR